MAQARVKCSATTTAAGIQLSTSRAITLPTKYSEHDRDIKEEENLLKQFDIHRFLSKLLQGAHHY